MSLLDPDNWPHLISLAHTTNTQDEYAGDVPASAAAYATDLPAWVQTADATATRDYAAKGQSIRFMIYLESDPGLRLNDEVIVTQGPYANMPMGIIDYKEATIGFELLWVLYCDIYRQTPIAS